MPEGIELVHDGETHAGCQCGREQIRHTEAESVAERDPQIHRNDRRTGLVRDRQHVGCHGEVVNHADDAAHNRGVWIDERADHQGQRNQAERNAQIVNLVFQRVAVELRIDDEIEIEAHHDQQADDGLLEFGVGPPADAVQQVGGECGRGGFAHGEVRLLQGHPDRA